MSRQPILRGPTSRGLHKSPGPMAAPPLPPITWQINQFGGPPGSFGPPLQGLPFITTEPAASGRRRNVITYKKAGSENSNYPAGHGGPGCFIQPDRSRKSRCCFCPGPPNIRAPEQLPRMSTAPQVRIHSHLSREIRYACRETCTRKVHEGAGKRERTFSVVPRGVSPPHLEATPQLGLSTFLQETVQAARAAGQALRPRTLHAAVKAQPRLPADTRTGRGGGPAMGDRPVLPGNRCVSPETPLPSSPPLPRPSGSVLLGRVHRPEDPRMTHHLGSERGMREGAVPPTPRPDSPAQPPSRAFSEPASPLVCSPLP